MIGALWLVVIVAGFSVLAHEEFTPVKATLSVADFPVGSAIPLASDKPTLILFLHPHCPCSRASLHELDELLAETQGRVSVTFAFVVPRGVPSDWEQGDLWNAATRMPGAHVFRDFGGVEARRFHIIGSGHTLLYDPSGKLVFSGGITPSRGHEGDNSGRAAIVSLVLTGHSLVSRTPVFGCALL